MSLSIYDESERDSLLNPKYNTPGLDGFGLEFYMACWDILKEDVLEAVQDFIQGATFPRF